MAHDKESNTSVAWKLGDNINTDQIIPARFYPTADLASLGKKCLSELRPDLAMGIKQGDVIVAGRNFGCGSSREYAPIALKHTGAACIIAKSFARIFYRNAINIGLPLLISEEAYDAIEEGEEVAVDPILGTITNLNMNKTIQANPISPFMMAIMEEGGIVNYLKKNGVDGIKNAAISSVGNKGVSKKRMENEFYDICVMPGDGIGQEVVPQAMEVLKATGLKFRFTEAEIGFGCYEKNGTPLPDSTIELIKKCDSCLFGAVTTPPNIPNYRSPVVGMRQKLGLYANLRPSRSMPIQSFRQGVDIIVVRENTEGMYSGRERVEDDGNTAITERLITRSGSENIIRFAFDYAMSHGRKKVTCVHKANVLRQTCGLFLRIFYEIAKDYPVIIADDMIVDATAMQLIKKPEQFDVIVTTNLFGDILSDEACMLVGGLGLAGSGNIGRDCSVFEPVHGSAPKYAGTDTANPMAAVMAAKMMLEHLGENEAASMIEKAVFDTIMQGIVTQDLGGKARMSEVTAAIIRNIKNEVRVR